MKSRNASKVVEQSAALMRSDQTIRSPFLMGEAGTDEMDQGVDYPNVQSTLSDLALAFIPVGGILITEHNRDPLGTPETEALTFAGTASSEYISIYGTTVDVGVGDDATEVASKAELALLAEVGTKITSVTRVDHVLQVVHKHYRPHKPVEYTNGSLTITGDIPARPDGVIGYGTWEYVGNELKFGTTLYYWRRLS